MSDRYATEPTTRPTPNPHDTAMAVFRSEVYTEAIDWLKEQHHGSYSRGGGFQIALDRLTARRDEVATAPGAGLLDHASAAYARWFADRLEATGYVGAAGLLRHVADDFDGAADSLSRSRKE